MFSTETLKLICILLEESVKDEKNLEDLRSSIYERDLDKSRLVKVFDLNESGFITIIDVRKLFIKILTKIN